MTITDPTFIRDQALRTLRSRAPHVPLTQRLALMQEAHDQGADYAQIGDAAGLTARRIEIILEP